MKRTLPNSPRVVRQFCFYGDVMKQEFLSDTVFVCTDGAVSFGQDALALARFCGATPADKAADLGTGCGIIPLLWAAENSLPKTVLAVERFSPAAALAAETVEKNGLTDRISVCEGDWNDLSPAYNGQFSLISCNPPYYKRESGKISPEPARAAARTEENDEALPRLMKTAARLLSPDGRFCFCMRPERQNDVDTALKAADLKLVYSAPLENEAGAWLTLFCAKRRNT